MTGGQDESSTEKEVWFWVQEECGSADSRTRPKCKGSGWESWYQLWIDLSVAASDVRPWRTGISRSWQNGSYRRAETDQRAWEEAAWYRDGERYSKKGHGHLQQNIEMRYRFIQQYRSSFPMMKMCQVLKVSQSGYYRWRTNPLSVRKVKTNDWEKEYESCMLNIRVWLAVQW